MAYDDFEQVDKLDLEEMDLKWQMAMLTVKVRRFEKKAGRKLNLRGRDPARFDRRKVKCYSCGEIGNFSRECTMKKTEDNTRYSAYKQKELESSNSKALVTTVDSCIDWKEHDTEDAESSASQQFSCLASCDEEFAFMGISPQVSEYFLVVIENIMHLKKLMMIWNQNIKTVLFRLKLIKKLLKH